MSLYKIEAIMCSIKRNLKQISLQINEVVRKCGRNTSSVQLLVVSKNQSVDAIADAVLAGHRKFGENCVQEGTEKITHFRKHHVDLEWHFIGPIQSNKTRQISEHFDWVHSIDRSKVARRLSEQRPVVMPPLQVLIQINTSGENSKSGAKFDEVKALADNIDQLPNIRLRGLMCIPQPATNYNNRLASFAPISILFKAMQATRPRFDTLSIGMSDDMDAAIVAGSTMVRIGRAIFGVRNYNKNKV